MKLPGYRIPDAGGGIENLSDDLQLAHDERGVYILIAGRVSTHLSPEEAEHVARLLPWHAMKAMSLTSPVSRVASPGGES